MRQAEAVLGCPEPVDAYLHESARCLISRKERQKSVKSNLFVSAFLRVITVCTTASPMYMYMVLGALVTTMGLSTVHPHTGTTNGHHHHHHDWTTRAKHRCVFCLADG